MPVGAWGKAPRGAYAPDCIFMVAQRWIANGPSFEI